MKTVGTNLCTFNEWQEYMRNERMKQYKNWRIEENEFGYYEATNLNDCDATMKFAKTIDKLKLEIDEKV